MLSFASFACTGGSDGSVGAGCGKTPDPRLLLASQDGLSEMKLDGSKRPIITWADRSYPLDPVISPDCKRIAFVLQPPAKPLPDGGLDFGSDLHVVGLDGKSARELARHQKVAEFLRTPAWLSETELLYTYRGRDSVGFADFRIERLDINTGKSTRFIEWGIDPAVSPDRRQIVYVDIDPKTDAEVLTIANADGSGKRGLVDNSSNLALFSAQAFSPDGKTIAFAAVDLSSPPGGAGAPRAGGVFAAHPFAQDVWLVNTDGTGLRRLGEIAENMPSVAWSGDGSAIYAIGGVGFWKLDPAAGAAKSIGPGVPLGQIAWLSGP
jgi:Tol biopolymer transport system component